MGNFTTKETIPGSYENDDYVDDTYGDKLAASPQGHYFIPIFGSPQEIKSFLLCTSATHNPCNLFGAFGLTPIEQDVSPDVFNTALIEHSIEELDRIRAIEDLIITILDDEKRPVANKTDAELELMKELKKQKIQEKQSLDGLLSYALAAKKVSLPTAIYPSICKIIQFGDGDSESSGQSPKGQYNESNRETKHNLQHSTQIPETVDFMQIPFKNKSWSWGHSSDGRYRLQHSTSKTSSPRLPPSISFCGFNKKTPPIPKQKALKDRSNSSSTHFIHPPPSLFRVIPLEGYDFSRLIALPTTNLINIKHVATILLLDLLRPTSITTLHNFVRETSTLLLHGSIYELTNVDIYVVYLNGDRLDGEMILTKNDVMTILSSLNFSNNIHTLDIPTNPLFNYHNFPLYDSMGSYGKGNFDFYLIEREHVGRLSDEIWKKIYQVHFNLYNNGHFDYCHPKSPFDRDQLDTMTVVINERNGVGNGNMINNANNDDLDNNNLPANHHITTPQSPHPLLTTPLQLPPSNFQPFKSATWSSVLNSLPLPTFDELNDGTADSKIYQSYLKLIKRVSNTWSSHCPHAQFNCPNDNFSINHCDLDDVVENKIFDNADKHYDYLFFKKAFQYQYHQWFHHYYHDNITQQLLESYKTPIELGLDQNNEILVGVGAKQGITDLKNTPISANSMIKNHPTTEINNPNNTNNSHLHSPQVLPLFSTIYPFHDPRAFYQHKLHFISNPYALPLVESHSSTLGLQNSSNYVVTLPSMYIKQAMAKLTTGADFKSFINRDDKDKSRVRFDAGAQIPLDPYTNDDSSRSNGNNDHNTMISLSFPQVINTTQDGCHFDLINNNDHLYKSTLSTDTSTLCSQNQEQAQNDLIIPSQNSSAKNLPQANLDSSQEHSQKEKNINNYLDLSSLPNNYEFESFILWDNPLISDPHYLLPQPYAISPYSPLYREIEKVNKNSRAKFSGMVNVPQVLQSKYKTTLQSDKTSVSSVDNCYQIHYQGLLDDIDEYMHDKYFILPNRERIGDGMAVLKQQIKQQQQQPHPKQQSGYSSLTYRLPSILNLLHPSPHSNLNDSINEGVDKYVKTVAWAQPLTHFHSRVSWTQPLILTQLQPTTCTPSPTPFTSALSIEYIPKPYEISPAIRSNAMMLPTTPLSSVMKRVNISMTYTYLQAGFEHSRSPYNKMSKKHLDPSNLYHLHPLSNLVDSVPLLYLYGVWVFPFVYVKKRSEKFVETELLSFCQIDRKGNTTSPSPATVKKYHRDDKGMQYTPEETVDFYLSKPLYSPTGLVSQNSTISTPPSSSRPTNGPIDNNAINNNNNNVKNHGYQPDKNRHNDYKKNMIVNQQNTQRKNENTERKNEYHHVYPANFTPPPIPFFDLHSILTPSEAAPPHRVPPFYSRDVQLTPIEERIDRLQGATAGPYPKLETIKNFTQFNSPLTFLVLCMNPVLPDPVPYHEDFESFGKRKVADGWGNDIDDANSGNSGQDNSPFLSLPEPDDPHEVYIPRDYRGISKPNGKLRPKTPIDAFEPITLSQFHFFQKNLPILNKNHLIHGVFYPNYLSSVEKLESLWDVQFHHVNNFTSAMERIEQRAVEHRMRLFHANMTMFHSSLPSTLQHQ